MNQPCRWLSLLTATATWRYERCLCCTVDNANHSCGEKRKGTDTTVLVERELGHGVVLAWCTPTIEPLGGGCWVCHDCVCWGSLLTWSHDYKQKETKKDWSNSVWTILFSWRHVVSSFFVGMNLILAPNVCCVVFLRKEMDKRKECMVFVLLVRRCGTCGEKKVPTATRVQVCHTSIFWMVKGSSNMDSADPSSCGVGLDGTNKRSIEQCKMVGVYLGHRWYDGFSSTICTASSWTGLHWGCQLTPPSTFLNALPRQTTGTPISTINER